MREEGKKSDSVTADNSGLRRALMLASYFPPLGRAGASVRLVRFLQYADHSRWRFCVLTPAPGGTVAPIPNEADSLLPSIPGGIIIERRKSLLRVSRTSFDTGESTGPMGGQTILKTFLRKVAHSVKIGLFVPDEDIIWILSNLFFALRKAKGFRPDVICASAPQYSMLLLGSFLSRMFRIPLVIDLRDDWHENSKRQKKPKTIVMLERWMEQKIFQKAARILVPTPEGCSTVVRRIEGIEPERVLHLPNGADLAELASGRESIQTRRNAVFTIVCASGGLGPRYRDIGPFLRAFSRFRDRANLGTKLEFLGSDVYPQYGALIEAMSLGNAIECRLGLSRQEYVASLLEADCLLLVQMDDAESSISGTLYEYLAAGEAPIVLLGGKGATRRLFEESQAGYAYNLSDVEGMFEGLSKLFESWSGGRPRLFPRAVDVSIFDRKVTAQKFQQVLDECAA